MVSIVIRNDDNNVIKQVVIQIGNVDVEVNARAHVANVMVDTVDDGDRRDESKELKRGLEVTQLSPNSRTFCLPDLSLW